MTVSNISVGIFQWQNGIVSPRPGSTPTEEIRKVVTAVLGGAEYMPEKIADKSGIFCSILPEVGTKNADPVAEKYKTRERTLRPHRLVAVGSCPDIQVG